MVNGEYDLVQKWTTTQTEDDLARKAIKACIDKGYDMTSNNCMHAVAAALSAAGKPHASVSTKWWFVSGGGRPPVEFFNANKAYATTLNMNDFRRGLIE